MTDMRRFFFSLFIFTAVFFSFSIVQEANAQGELCREQADERRAFCRAQHFEALQGCIQFNTELSDEQCQANYNAQIGDCADEYAAAIAQCPSITVPTATPSQTAPPTIGEQFQSIQDQGLIFANICESRLATCECRDLGQCSLNDILQVAVNIMIFILGISGTAVLLMFVYGGFLWLTSSGRPEAITNGKNTMIGAVVGLIIIFGSYAAITLLIGVLRTGSIPTGDIEDVVGGDSQGVIDTAR